MRYLLLCLALAGCDNAAFTQQQLEAITKACTANNGRYLIGDSALGGANAVSCTVKGRE